MTEVLTDCQLYLGPADLTGHGNKIDIAEEYEDLDKTTFGSGGAKTRVAGIADVMASVDTFWEAGDPGMPDDILWAIRGTANTPFTAAPNAGASGDVCYLSRVFSGAHKPGGDVGKLMTISADLKGNWPAARGKILHPGGTVRTATGTGTGYQMGAIATSGRAMYACLHVLSLSAVSGSPTLTVIVESDDNSGFTTPTTRIAFTTATAVTGEAKRVLGPITDTWWRAKWTVAGGATSPSFLFAVSAGLAKK
jgi:hypothetical protein